MKKPVMGPEKRCWCVMPQNGKQFYTNDVAWANDSAGKYGWVSVEVIWDDRQGAYVIKNINNAAGRIILGLREASSDVQQLSMLEMTFKALFDLIRAFPIDSEDRMRMEKSAFTQWTETKAKGFHIPWPNDITMRAEK